MHQATFNTIAYNIARVAEDSLTPNVTANRINSVHFLSKNPSFILQSFAQQQIVSQRKIYKPI